MAVDYYLKLDGIQGESKDQGLQGSDPTSLF
jgi:type VI protein secretion system component Hcp